MNIKKFEYHKAELPWKDGNSIILFSGDVTENTIVPAVGDRIDLEDHSSWTVTNVVFEPNDYKVLIFIKCEIGSGNYKK